MKKVFLATCLFLVANIDATDARKTFLVVENNTDSMQEFGFIYNFGDSIFDEKKDIVRTELKPGSHKVFRTDELTGRTVFMRNNPHYKYAFAIIDIYPDTDGIIFLADFFDYEIQPHSGKHHLAEPKTHAEHSDSRPCSSTSAEELESYFNNA